MQRLITSTACAIISLAIVSPALAQKTGMAAAAASPTLTRIKQAGRIKLGYQADARPFSYRDQSGNPAGFTVAICKKVADEVKTELALQTLTVEWVAVGAADRFTAVSTGKVDAFCGADTDTWSRRAEVAFSFPVFPGGIGALLRKDAPERLVEILKQDQYAPLSVAKQVMVIYAATSGCVDSLEVADCLPFEQGLLRFVENSHPSLLTKIEEKKQLDDSLKQELDKVLDEFKSRFVTERKR